MEMSRLCGTYGENINAYNILFGKLKGKRVLGKLRLRCENNIKIDLKITVRKHGLNSSASGYRPLAEVL
jgi:hypothetical protein